jgi:hypothetical protein
LARAGEERVDKEETDKILARVKEERADEILAGVGKREILSF